MKFSAKPLPSPFLEWATNYEDAWLSTQHTSQIPTMLTKPYKLCPNESKFVTLVYLWIAKNITSAKMYYIVQITQSNNFYAKSFNFPYSLYYLGALVLLSSTQFSPSAKHFLTFPLSLASNPQNSSTRAISGGALIGRDVCHTDLGWMIA